MKKKIEAKIVADSLSPQGERITSFILTYPRFIHAELMTHRLFSRNSASSRAIPFEKMVKMVEEDPFIPIAWQKDHKGMQGMEYFTDGSDLSWLRMNHLKGRNQAIERATDAHDRGLTKQIVNRYLEPFMWHTVLVTSTEWENFFDLRCPKYQTPVSQTVEPQRSWKDLINVHSNPINEDLLEENKHNWVFKMQHSLSGAEIHIQALAEAMWDIMNESTPVQLKESEWHIPFGDTFNQKEIDKFAWITNKERNLSPVATEIAIAIARCARLSYMTFEGEIDYEKDIKLHDVLLKNKHASPFEHVARAMSNEEYNKFFKGEMPNSFVNNPKGLGWCNNFKGFIQYRYLIENDKQL